MDYEWSEEPQNSYDSSGRSYGKGRGFISHNNNNNNINNNSWDSENINNEQSNADKLWQSDADKLWQSDADDYKVTGIMGKNGEGGGKGGEEGGKGGEGGGRGRGRGRGKGRGRGEGGRGGRGVGRGRGGFKNRDGNDNDNNDYKRNNNYEDDADAGNQNDQDGKQKKTSAIQGSYGTEVSQKPRERYIPPDLPSDEKTLFKSGVEMGINFDKYDFIGVKVTGENPPLPIETFENIGLRAIVLQNIQKSGYTKPTPIQKNALPIIMGGRDLMACAQTGSGKTAAFAIPIIHLLLQRGADLGISPSYCEPQAVIVAPTRELTIQIWQEIVKFSYNSILKTSVAYGGTSVIHQGGKISAGCHILVATPGRLLDFVERGRIKFSSLQFLVLDEADRMLDMGFLPNVERIVDHETMPSNRQTLMFSATFPDEVQHLAKRFLNNYLFVAVGAVGGACSDVEQNFYEVSRGKKKDLLKEILQREYDAGTLRGTLVFVEMKKKADFIAVFLSESNYPTTSIHGDRLQRQREEALADFKSGKMFVLVATAVAARGLDIKNVAHVINYDLPKGIDEYVHRIGRTGRVGNRGRATSFFEPDDDAPLRDDLIKILKQAEQPVPDWLLGASSSRSYMPGKGTNRYGGADIREYISGYSEKVYYSPTALKPEITVEPEEAW